MLCNYVIPTETIKTTGGEIEVRGLGIEDFTIAFRRHGESLFPLLSGSPDIGDLVTRAPALAVDLIALAADAPDAVDTIARMPVSTQIRVLTAVTTLTLGDYDMGELYRLLAQTILMAKQATRENAS